MLAFYFLPFRAFELLIGCALALKGVRFPADKRIAATLVAVGLGLILGSMLLIDEAMRFPGLLCLPPCIGAALIIYGGDRVQTAPSKLLSLKPLLAIGAISYWAASSTLVFDPPCGVVATMSALLQRRGSNDDAESDVRISPSRRAD